MIGIFWVVLWGSYEWVGLLSLFSTVSQWKLLSSWGRNEPVLLTTPVYRKYQFQSPLGNINIKKMAPPNTDKAGPVNVDTGMISEAAKQNL